MKDAILIKGKPFFYEKKNLTLENAEAVSFEDAKGILFKAKELLDNQGIKFYLIFGTLLGAIREHSFISHDYDVDIYVDDVEKLKLTIPYLYEQGFKLCRVQEPRLYSFTFRGIYIDIYTRRPAPFPLNLCYCWLGQEIIPKRYLDKSECIDFLGEKFLIPSKPERLMVQFYGKSWRTPIKGAHGRYSIYPVYFYRKIKQWFKNNVR